jgi:hypothetical protein
MFAKKKERRSALFSTKRCLVAALFSAFGVYALRAV